MKYLVLLLVIAVAAVWWLAGRRRLPPAGKAPGTAAQRATPMLACAHCGVHQSESDMVRDAAGRPYCGHAHREAGPR